jgi:hypothetical protein
MTTWGKSPIFNSYIPKIVIGYVVVFDVTTDGRRQDGLMWSEYFEHALGKIAIRKAPLWNQGLLEGFWFIRIDSQKPVGSRVLDPDRVAAQGTAFFGALISELRRREPAIPFDGGHSPSPS